LRLFAFSVTSCALLRISDELTGPVRYFCGWLLAFLACTSLLTVFALLFRSA
jgi:hypothetical protein